MDNNIKIAAPTNDRQTLAERSGRAAEFAVFSIENGTIKNVEFRKNEHEHHHHHGHGNGDHEHAHGHADIVEALNDCAAVVGRKFGPHFASDFHQAGIRMMLSRETALEEAVLSAWKKLNN
jgi:predicted Fe-Mo cluster-binding NifX family protein